MPQHRSVRRIGMIGEFTSSRDLLAAIKLVRDAGHESLDAFSPFPVHGLDRALGIRPTRLAWAVLTAGILAGLFAFAGQAWTNGVDYPYLISGKPLIAWEASLPVAFELVILVSALTAFLGVFLLCGLPKLSSPLLKTRQFRRVTNDRFFLLVEGASDRPESADLRRLLRSAGALRVRPILDCSSSDALPPWVWAVGVILLAALPIPPLLVARARTMTSERPALRSFKDMDFQPGLAAQAATNLFQDGRAMRPTVAGTVARGRALDDDPRVSGRDAPGTTDAKSRDAGPPSEAAQDGTDWVKTFPVPVSAGMMQRGRQRYNTFCANCHGRGGDGDGPVSVRALALEQGTWVPPTSLHAEHVRKQPPGQLFHTTTHGIRKMPGYGELIGVEDRWAILLYLRALQRTRTATPADVSPEELSSLRELK